MTGSTINERDWSRTPAAIITAGVLGLVSVGGIAWTIANEPSSVAASPMDSRDAVPERISVIHLVDLNGASSEEIELLPGVGPVTASAIIAYRDEFGPFETLNDLDDVHGIGPKTILNLRDRVTLGPVQAPSGQGG